MAQVQNLQLHVDDLLDGRPICAYEIREVPEKALEHQHYASRLADGRFLLIPKLTKAEEAARTKAEAQVKAEQSATDTTNQEESQ